MDHKKFRLLSRILVLTICMTLVTQFYWNWRNYQENKRYFQSEVQGALDNAVEQYYTELGKIHFVQLNKLNDSDSLNELKFLDSIPQLIHLDSTEEVSDGVWKANRSIEKFKIEMDSIGLGTKAKVMVLSGGLSDTCDEAQSASIRYNSLAAKLVVSLGANRLNITRLDSLIVMELSRRKINMTYNLRSNIDGVENIADDLTAPDLMVEANTAYLPPDLRILLTSSDHSLEILYLGILGITVSTLTTVIIIFVLLYLYRIIHEQKSLDDMKNDFISNITHEFKTPIATVSTALEAIEKFNLSQDLGKTKKYLNLSNDQLEKLDSMVERLLETASLEENKIVLDIREFDLTQLLRELIDKFNLTAKDKQIQLTTLDGLCLMADRFHFGNVISNLLDNAVKYGGKKINVKVSKVKNRVAILVTDNGSGIGKREANRVFQKFYRVTSGDIHEVKGHGIGLFYSKVIIEKHQGTISLDSKSGQTVFKVEL